MSLIANQTKIWVDKGSVFYSRSVKSWLKDNNIEMYSAHNEGKFVVSKIFIITLKNKNYKYMTSISKNVYMNKSADIVNEYSNTYHSTIKMKPANVSSSTYFGCGVESNDKGSKFDFGNLVRISNYKNIFAQGYIPGLSEEVFVIKKS